MCLACGEHLSRHASVWAWNPVQMTAGSTPAVIRVFGRYGFSPFLLFLLFTKTLARQENVEINLEAALAPDGGSYHRQRRQEHGPVWSWYWLRGSLSLELGLVLALEAGGGWHLVLQQVANRAERKSDTG
jgi:hypothetical protein